MATNPTDSSIAVSNTGTAAVRTETVTDSAGASVEEQVVIAEGVVNDTPSVLFTGETAPMSFTNDGRLRVSMTPARYAVDWVMDGEERMWGRGEDSLQNEFTHTGSPWGDW